MDIIRLLVLLKSKDALLKSKKDLIVHYITLIRTKLLSSMFLIAHSLEIWTKMLITLMVNLSISDCKFFSDEKRALNIKFININDFNNHVLTNNKLNKEVILS